MSRGADLVVAAARMYLGMGLPPPLMVPVESPRTGALMAMQLELRRLAACAAAWREACSAAGLADEGDGRLSLIEDAKQALARAFGRELWSTAGALWEAGVPPAVPAAAHAALVARATASIAPCARRVEEALTAEACGNLMPKVHADLRWQVLAAEPGLDGEAVRSRVAAIVWDRLGRWTRDRRADEHRRCFVGRGYRELVGTVHAGLGGRAGVANFGQELRPVQTVLTRIVQQALAGLPRGRDEETLDDLLLRACAPSLAAGAAAADVDESCGRWWWSYEGVLIAGTAPDWTDRDARGRLHGPARAAIGFPDGWGVHAWHGVLMPDDAILAPASITAERVLATSNAEVRRALIECAGMERLLGGAGAKVVDADASGTLLALAVPGDESLLALKVTCPSTGHVYFLRVPPYLRTARSARAWTFDEDPGTFAPLVET